MAMAGALLLAMPCARAIKNAPIAENCRGSRSRLEHGHTGAGLNRGSVDLRNVEAGFARDGGSTTCCCGGLGSSRVQESVKNGRCGWSASELVRFGDQRLFVTRKILLRGRKFSGVALRIAAEKTDVNAVVGTLLKFGKQGLDAGTKLIPESVPRPLAQAGVGLAGLVVGSFVLKSLFSTVFFILAIGALSYIGFVFLTKGESGSSDKDSRGSSGRPKSTDDALEEARKIMEKYK